MILDIQFAENAQSFNSTFGEIIKVGNATDDTQTYILVTPDGREIPAVMVEELTVFDATPNDIRIGKVAATDSGVTVGEKVIPSYHTHEGNQIIMPGKSFSIGGRNYDYTKLQAIVCAFNTNLSNSVATEKVAINSDVYDVLSVNSVAKIIKNHDTQMIDFGITNKTTKPQILRYFYYKEIY